MAQPQRDRSKYFTSQGIALIEEAMQVKGWDEEKLSIETGIGYDSICRYLKSERPPQKKNIKIIAKILGLKPSDLVEGWISETKSDDTKLNLDDLRIASKNLLEDLKRLTTEALTAGDGIRFDFDDIFVPLGVVERQQKTKRKEDDGAPDRGSELYEEKVTPITHDEFFEDVLLRGHTKISNGKRIAVIGEAGAGKTTQLQKIGSWLLEESDDIPVWISLTDLGAKSLREYLFENWVREASGEIETAPQVWKDSLGDAIKSGKVWLLLDGVDEMTVSNPLSYLSTQLKESWLKNVRVILTCRVNVWDGGKNALTGFDVYRNLDFDYPNDVYQFIGKWFAHTSELAGSLTQALEQSGKERIRDMVKNPLRLTLLCYSWQLKQGELPETKAGLYEWFVEAFYKWNKGKAQIELSRSQEEKLNQALGELAKRAIDGETSRFRLTKTFIENVFREFDIDLFDIALKLNWLNEIGVAAEDPLEKVYAFYHPSFQEYFAALAIDDWDFFLPKDHADRPIRDRYRLFEDKWKYALSLWEELIHQEYKNEFVSKLAEFDDGCDNYYGWQCVERIGWDKIVDYSTDGEPNFYIETTTVYWQWLLKGCSWWGESWNIYWDFLVKYLGIPNDELKKSFMNIPIPPHLASFCNDPFVLGLEVDLMTLTPYVTSTDKSINLDKLTFLDLLITFKTDKTNYIDKLKILAAIIQMCRQNTCLYNCLIEKFIYGNEFDLATIWILDEIGFELLEKDIVSKITAKMALIIVHTKNKLLQAIAARTLFTIIYEAYSPDSGSKFSINIFGNSIISQIISEIKFLHIDDSNDPYLILQWKNRIIQFFAESTSYSDFYKAWHSPNISIHPEIADTIPSNNTNKIQALESQLIDCEAIQKELDSNTDHPEIRCLVVDIRQLEQESDPNVIAKKLTNKIFNSIGRRIPVVQDVSCLERELLNSPYADRKSRDLI